MENKGMPIKKGENDEKGKVKTFGDRYPWISFLPTLAAAPLPFQKSGGGNSRIPTPSKEQVSQWGIAAAKLAAVTIASAALTITVLSLGPTYQKILEGRDAAESLASLKTAGEAISLFEADNGHLPAPKEWVWDTKKYLKGTSKSAMADPVYFRLMKTTPESQPDNPGWGMNNWLNLTIGSSYSDQIKSTQSRRLPPDAIIMAPSFQQSFRPQRNGILPLQPMGQTISTPTQHGRRLGTINWQAPLGLGTWREEGLSGLYLLNDRSIRKMTLDQARDYLKIRPVPASAQSRASSANFISRETETALKDLTSQDVAWEEEKAEEGIPAKGSIFRLPRHLVVSNASVLTPLIPVPQNGKTLEISFETSSESPVIFWVSSEYFNEFGFIINSEQPTEANTATLTKPYIGRETIQTDKPIGSEKGITIGFNPSFGFASHETTVESVSKKAKEATGEERKDWVTKIERVEAFYDQDVPVVRTKTWGATFTQQTQQDGEWKKTTVLVKPSALPPFTKYVALRVENKTPTPLLIRSIRLSEKSEPNDAPAGQE
jgi:hypothetical protein